MVRVIENNIKNGNEAMRFFELANIYLPKALPLTEPPVEKKILCLGTCGAEEDFFAMKGIILEALDKLGVYGVEFTANKENPTFHRGRCADISIGEKKIGVIGEIAPAVLDNYGIGTRAYVATLDIADIFDARIVEKKFKPTPKFPASTRDLAIICDDELPAASLEKAIRAGAGKLLEKVELFDVYKGSSIAEGKKSVAYTMTLRAADRTLTVEETEKVARKILGDLEHKLGITLR